MELTFSEFKKKEYVVFVAIALLFSLLLLGCVSQTAAPTITPTAASTATATIAPTILPSPSPEPELVSVVFVINNGTANYSKTLEVTPGSAVLEVLEDNFVVTKKEYSFGALVTGIDGLEQNASANRYWQFYVDGSLASVGADAFKLEKSVSVEWRFEEPPAFG